MKKRYIFILLFVVVCLVLVSCKDDVTPTSITTSNISIPTTTQSSTKIVSSTTKTGGNMELPWV